MEELEKQLDQPIMNGDHDDSTADKHSIGPGSPVAEMHGLAIADVPLSEEPVSAEPEEIATDTDKAESLVPNEEHASVSEDTTKNMDNSDVVPDKNGSNLEDKDESASLATQIDVPGAASELKLEKVQANNEVIEKARAEMPDQIEAEKPNDDVDKNVDSSTLAEPSVAPEKPVKEVANQEGDEAEHPKDFDTGLDPPKSKQDDSNESAPTTAAGKELGNVEDSESAPTLSQKLVDKTTDLVSTVKDKLVANKDEDEDAK